MGDVMNCQLKQTACPWLPRTSFRGLVRAQTPAQLAGLQSQDTWGRFSRMTRVVSPSPEGRRRAIRHCSLPCASERSRLTSILTVGPISLQSYRVAVDSRFPDMAGYDPAPFLCRLKPHSFLERFP